MFCSKGSASLINKIHRRALQAQHMRFDLTLESLLILNEKCSIHTRHLQILLTEVYKSLNKLNPSFMWNLFEKKITKYDLQYFDVLKLNKTNTNRHGLNSIIFRGSLLWNTIPNEFKQARSLIEFKRKIKQWDGNCCTCLSCR